MEGSRSQYACQVLHHVEEFMRRRGIDATRDLPPGSDHFTVGPKSLVAFLVEYLPTIRPPNLVQYDSRAQSHQRDRCEWYIVQWQPGMKWHTVKTPVTSMFGRDWHRQVQPFDRVMTIVWHSILIHPTRDVAAMTDARMQHVLAAMRLFEGDIYQVAQNKTEYNALMTLETSKMREYIVQERRRYGDHLLQDVSAAWYFDVPVEPSSQNPPRQEQKNLRSAAAVTFVPQSLEAAAGYTPLSFYVETREKTPFMAETERNKSKEPASGGRSSLCCHICLETFEEIVSKNRKVSSTKCGHVFCDDCIQKYFKDQRRCPTCRQHLVPVLDVQPLFL